MVERREGVKRPGLRSEGKERSHQGTRRGASGVEEGRDGELKLKKRKVEAAEERKRGREEDEEEKNMERK